MLQPVAELDDSIVTWIRSRSFDNAAELLLDNWRSYLGDDAAVLRERVLALPDSLWSAHPELLLAVAFSLRVQPDGSVYAALPYLDAVDAMLSADESQKGDLRVLALLARAAVERGLGQLADGHAHAVEAHSMLKDLPTPLPLKIELQSLALLEIGISLTVIGEPEGASLHLRNGLALATESHPRAIRIEALGCTAIVEYLSGSAGSAEPSIANARAAAEGSSLLQSAAAAPMLIAEALLAIDDGEYERAERIHEALAPLARGTHYEVLAMHIGAVTRGARNGPLDELESLQDIQIVLRTWQGPSLAHQLHDAERVNALISLGAISGARDAVVSLNEQPADPHHTMCTARLAARLQLQTGDFEGVLETTSACRMLGDNHSPRSLAWIDVLRAAAHDALGDASTAARAFDRALSAAARTGWRRHLMTLPHDRLHAMIGAARERPQTEEIRALLDELDSNLDSGVADSIPPLSSRERIILQHIVAGETRRQISAQLRVSPNTVKTQIRSIYRKLGAANRHEAIDRAAKYGIH